MRPDYTMEPHHHLVAVIFVLHTEDAMRLMQFLATVHMSKLKMTRTPRVSNGPVLRVDLDAHQV